ncbi:membrane dipeptidase-like protein [Amylocarpus encephaloides]|uniref:Dipeptidase n=1 Tax=Amylocarpus encephaloides TaxID=45428 RepID=A0A9P7YA81_9HELO|nr:membrane dipeptidase-like protein [Amylocarpus encephaloides]
MASSTEQDPLLVKGTSSAASSCNRASDPPFSQQATSKHEKDLVLLNALLDDNRPRRRIVSNTLSIIWGLCFVFSLVFTLMPQKTYDDILTCFRPLPVPQTVEQRVNRILADTPLIDGHNDLAILIRFLYNNRIYDDKFTKPFEDGGMYAHVDLPRLKEGKNGGAFWSAFVPCPSNNSDFTDSNYADSVAFTLSQIDLLTRLQEAYPSRFSSPPNSTTALKAFKSGQLISPLAIEGLHQIGNSISNLRLFHSLGVRYATLTHNCHNIYADAALLEVPGGHEVEVAKPKWGGVSQAGRKLIHEMNRIGMMVDLAHVSQDTMRDVLGGSSDWEGSLAPPIYSHSSAYAICPHPRNVPDDILQLVKMKNSIVMVNFSPDFVSCIPNRSNPSGLPDFYPQNSTLAHVVKHIRHIGDLIGYDHVGLGSDFDGIPTTPEGLDDVSKFPELVAEMLRQGINDKDAAKIVGRNILRVWSDVDKVAQKMQASGEKPLEDKLPSLKFLPAFA